jgi:hypothetical protein
MSTALTKLIRRRRTAARFEMFFLAGVGIITTAMLQLVV